MLSKSAGWRVGEFDRTRACNLRYIVVHQRVPRANLGRIMRVETPNNTYPPTSKN